MEYNTQKEKLVIPEYGRHIQQMINYCVSIQDDEKRNQCTYSIIEVMGNLNPHLRDIPDFQHKLWDQLFIISNFKLKVDSPYPIPTREQMNTYPRKMDYPAHETNYKYYGSNIRKMIDAIKNWEEGEKKDSVKLLLANQMKKNYVKWNKDFVDDQIIFRHLHELSDGNLSFPGHESLMQVAPQNNNNNSINSSINNNNNNKKRIFRKRIKK